jgi:transcription elongation factor GreB
MGLIAAVRSSPATTYASSVSKAFTKEDDAEQPVVIRHRPPLPEGAPNYVTARGLQLLRAELATAEPGARRLELEQRIGSAVIAAPPADRSEVRFGAQVTTRDDGGEIRHVQIVGIDEADPAAGLIAYVAPLARALLGGHVGDSVTVRTPGGAEELEIVAIEYDP